MASIELIRGDLDSMSERISESSRTISLGVLALVWLFIAGGDETPILSITPSQALLMVSGALVLLSLLSDYLQYFFGYLNSKDVLAEAEASTEKEAKYQTDSKLYQARALAFWLKQVLSVGALITLGLALIPAVLKAG
jgi:hypothetical protein